VTLNKSGGLSKVRFVSRVFAWPAALLTGQVLSLFRLDRAAVRFFGWAANALPELRPIFLAERGMSNARLKRRENAVHDVEQAIKLAPENPQFLLYMAWVHEEVSSPDEAIVFYERAANAPGAEFSESMRCSIRSRIETLRGSNLGRSIP
jgi:tetratricopeptide (TPR) repeat protein